MVHYTTMNDTCGIFVCPLVQYIFTNLKFKFRYFKRGLKYGSHTFSHGGGGGVTTAAKEQHASLRYSSEMYIISKKMCITHICIVVTTQFKGTVYQFTTNSPGCVGTAFRNN